MRKLLWPISSRDRVEILIALTFRTFSVVVSDCFVLLVWFVQRALPTRSPLNAAGPDVTLNVAFTLAPGATESANIVEVFSVPKTKDVHCLFAREDAQLDAHRHP